MSRSGLGLVVGVIGLLGGAFALQRALAGDEREPQRPTTPQSRMEPLTIPLRPSSASPRVEEVALALPVETAPEVPASTGAAAPVWHVLQQPHADSASERQALVDAFRSSPSCDERWCEHGRSVLQSWTASLSEKFASAVSFDSVQCSAAGCWTLLIVQEPRRLPDVTATLQGVMSKQGWPGPSIQGAPDFSSQRGKVTAILALLPVEN